MGTGRPVRRRLQSVICLWPGLQLWLRRWRAGSDFAVSSFFGRMTLSQEGPLFMVIRVFVFTGLHLGMLCSFQGGREGYHISLHPLPSKGNFPVVFWSQASLASAVLEVIEWV